MSSQLTTYITLVCTSSVLNLYLCLYVFAKRHYFSNIAKLFILNTIFTSIYCVSYAFSLASTSLEEIKFWTTIQYIGMPFSPPLGLLFLMHYFGMNITRKRWLALLIIPLISLMMVATNDYHHMYYRVFEVDPILGIPYIHQEIGVWYMIHGIFTFACLFVGFLLILSQWKETAKEYRPQLISLMCGQLVPMVTAFVYLLGLTPPGIDPVPMVIWLTSLFYLWSISSSRMFTILPIAKDAIFNSISDGVMVLDETHRIIEFNDACKRMFPKLDKPMFGMDFENVWLELSKTPFPFLLHSSETTYELAMNDSQSIYQVRLSSLQQGSNREGLLIIFTDITELKNLQIQLEHQAYYDELTQIFNRRAFFRKCKQTFEDAQKSSLPFAIILFDIDYFKRVNDTYGHQAGDQLLRHIAEICQAQLQEDVLFARYGGEEFILALKGRSGLESKELANQLRINIESQPLITTEGIRIQVTSSFGVAMLVDVSSLTQLLNQADQALYVAKQKGRNQVQVYNTK